MHSLDYSNDNIYTGDISDISDIKYVNVFNFDYNFNTDKSIISDYTNSTASVCFYKNKGTTIFSSGKYNPGVINFSDKTFYRCSDLDHNFNIISGFKSSSSFFGSINVLLSVNGNWGLKINFYDVYNVVDSLWIYVKNNILYIKTNTNILYSRTFVNLTFEFSIYDKKIVIDSKNILSTIISAFLPYNFFIYGGINDIQITAKSFMPMTFEGTGKVIDDIYGDAYCITREIESFGYLKSTANNVLTSSKVFTFDIACRSVGQSIPFSISNNVSFDSSGFVMNDSCVWICIDTTISGFTGNILTTSGIVTVSGALSSVNDYYLVRCYYDGNKFGVIVNGKDAHTNCNNTVFSGSNLNILTNNFLSIDSFAFYDDILPSLELYNACLTKLNSAVFSTALVNSNNKILFAADNFYTNSVSYTGLFYNNWEIPLTYTTNTFYTNYSIAGGEVFLNNDNFYANKSLFNESVYNCFICENDKSFLTYFSGIIIPANKILAESFTNYDYVSENFITTNSGLYIRNYSKVFDKISSTISIIEFSNIDWSDYLGIGILFGIDSIPEYSDENCTIIVGNGISYIGTTSFSNLNASSNNSIYFYIDNSYITVSGSDTGILCSGIVTSTYEYIHYFVKSAVEGFSYRSLITLDKPTPLDNYQLKICLTSSVFDYSRARPNGEDLKFYYTGEGAEELDYWIENWDILGTSIVWVKITVSGTSEFYMYYGNPGAYSASNADNVFDFFDDFEGTSLDTNKWETNLVYGNYSISDSQINIWATTAWRDVYITTKAFKKIELPIIVSAKVRSSNGSCGELLVGLYNSTVDKTYSITRDTTCNWGACSDGPRIKQTVYGASSSEDIFCMKTTTNDIWFDLISKIRDDNKIEGYVDNILKGISTKTIDSDGYCRIRFGTSSPCEDINKHQYMDSVFVRKYALYEPKITMKNDDTYYKYHNIFASIENIYISTTQRSISTLTNKFFSYELPKQYVLDDSYKELFYNIENDISSNGIILYDYDFYDHQCSFSSYYDTTFSGMFNIFGYNFLGINDNFESGFITERWRLICDPYGVYGCNQPGWISVKTATLHLVDGSLPTTVSRVYDNNINLAINNSSFILSSGIYYQIDFYETQLVDSVDLYITSFNTNPKDGSIISCSIYAYYNSIWNVLVDNYVSPVLSGTITYSSDDKAVFNVNDKSNQITLNSSNLKATNISTGFHNVRSNICNNYGKWYWEIIAGNVSGTNDYKIGIADLDADLDDQLAASGIHAYVYNQDGTKQHDGSTVYGDSYTDDDVIGVALDLSVGKIWWSKNGIWQNYGNPASGINEAFNDISGDWYLVQAFYDYNSYCTANFGNSFFVYPIPDGFNSGVYSCTFVWPTHHVIYIPPVRCTNIKIVANDNWGGALPTEIRPSCFCNHGGTAVCITSHINKNNFNDSNLNTDIWNVYESDNSTIKIEDNKLHYVLTTNENSKYIYVIFKYNLTGDFDVQCDFSNLIGGNELNDTGFELRFKVDDFNDVFIKARFPLVNGFEGRITSCGVVNNYHNVRVNSYGKLRLIRYKSTITTYYIDGDNNWIVNCFRDRFSTMDGKIILGLWAPKNSGEVSVNVDNFLLNVKTLASRINNNDTNLYVVLDDILKVYAEYTLEDKFSLSFSGINYYPLNSKMYLKNYSEKECYIKTSWTNYSCCNIIASSEFGDLITTISGIFGKVEYFFNISRFLDIITISGSFVDTDANMNSNYPFFSDNLNLGLSFYNENIPNAIGSGCLFGIKSDYYTVSFSSVSTGYKYTALDDTNNMTKAGIGFNTYPPNLFINKVQGEYVGQSCRVYNKLITSGIQLSLNTVDAYISLEAKDIGCIGGIKQVSKFNRLSLFSSYLFELSALYKFYCVGEDQQYLTFSEIANIVNTGDKVYFYPGMYVINTNKQLTLIGVGNPADIKLQINNASAGLTVIGCTTTECAGSNVFNMYNCYILSWTFHISQNSAYIILYNVTNINFYNCDLYNYSYMSYNTSYVLLNKCTIYRTNFYSHYGNITIYNEGYVTRGHYGYGPEFNRSSVISGLSSVNFITTSSFYHNSIYNHFPLNNQIAIKEDKCNQLILSIDTYSVYFYGDIKKLNSFSMYIFIQDIVGTLEIANSSDFIIVIDPNDLDKGIHFTLNVYNAVVDIVIPIPYSSVFKLSIISIVFNGGSISIYLNGSKLATKYIMIADFNDINSYLNNSIIFFDETKFVCTGNGLLLKGASLSENIHFLVGTHVEELYSNYTTTITVNMELSTDSVLTDYHNLGTSSYYGYSCNNTGVGLYYDTANWEYKHIYFNANRSYKVYKNIVKTYIGSYMLFNYQNKTCNPASDTKYLSPQKNHIIKFGAARIDDKSFGYCNISEAYGYVNMKLQLPLPVIDRSLYCFDILNSIIALSFDLPNNPYAHDVGPNNLNVNIYNSCVRIISAVGIFHNSAVSYNYWWYCNHSKLYYYIQHNEILNLTKNFTIEFLFTYFDNNKYGRYLLTKGIVEYNIAYRVGINNRYIPYFAWSWEGDNILYAEKPIYVNKPVYLAVVIGDKTVSFYINGKNAGIKYTDELTIVNNTKDLKIAYEDISYYNGYKIAMEEICILNKIKTEKEILMTWEKISGGEKAPWIKINNIVVVSDEPIKVSPSDRGNSSDGLLDTSKWDYVAYKHPRYSNGIILDSRTSSKLISKVVSYNVIFDVSVFCEFLEYSISRNWSVTFKYKFVSGNYMSIVIDYVKYDDIYVKCEYYYNGYKDNTSRTKLILSPCGIRFVTDYNKYTYVQIGDWSYWHTLWKSTQNLFIETSGRLEIVLSNDDWDSWFIIKITNFLPRLYCDTIPDGTSLNFYESLSYGRAFYSQVPDNVASLCLSNDLFKVTTNGSCTHSLEFINGNMSNTHVFDTVNRIFENINYSIFNIELLVYLTYDNTDILNLFPWISLDVRNKYLYIIMHDNDHTITDSINEFLNNYIYIAISISNPHTTLYINDKKFIYDTNFTEILPYYFYPIGKEFSGRVVYFCGYYGNFDRDGYTFRVSTLSRYIGFDTCARKVFGNNMATSIDPYSIIYSYDNPSYSSMLVSKGCGLGYKDDVDINILFDPSVLQASISVFIAIRCKYSNLNDKKTTSITISCVRHNVSHNYYDSFGDIGNSQEIFSYDLVGTCYNEYSIFILSMSKEILENILTGTAILNIKNNDTNIITNIYIYLNSELGVNDIYGSALLV